MDVLSDMMGFLRTKGHINGRMELSGPFGLHFPAEYGVVLIVTRGSCFLRVGDAPLTPLVSGDIAFLPKSKPFVLTSGADMQQMKTIDQAALKDYERSGLMEHDGGGGAPVSLISGCFTFSAAESYLLLEHLPEIIAIQAGGTLSTPWTQSILQLIASEVGQVRPGSLTVIDRLIEVLFIQGLRGNCDRKTCTTASPSWLQAMTDPQIGQAIGKMHNEPEHPWTVEELASAVGMSRSAFAARFRSLVGKTPLDHLTQWRMVRAASLIREPQPMKLDAIAAAVGYESESSFRKVFRRVMGSSPTEYRSGVINGKPN